MIVRIALVIALIVAGAAPAAVIDVTPGVGTPLQDAIDAASPGDTIRVRAGTYGENVSVTKTLKLIGDGADVVTVDGGCVQDATLTVGADGVLVKGLRVIGANTYEIDIRDRTKVRVIGTEVDDTCGTALYGINVYLSTDVKLIRNTGSGFSDAAIYVGEIPVDRKVRVLRNTVSGCERGIFVELTEDTQPGKGVIVSHNVALQNTRGIFLIGADGIKITGNEATDNTVSGIELDGNCNGNLIARNRISGSPDDVLDAGSGNCWRGNTFTTGTVPPCS